MTRYPDLHTHRFRAMGSEIAIWLQHSDAERASRLLREGEAAFEAAESWMSRFRPASELSQLNARAGEWVGVSTELWRAIEQALQAARLTNGLFDPAQLRAVVAAGYESSFDPSCRESVPQPTSTLDTKQLGDGWEIWQSVELRVSPRAVRVPAGVGMDLGGIGKGIVAQEVVQRLGAHGPCLVDAGGDLTAGDAPVGEPGWPVAIASPSGEAAASRAPRTGPALNLWLNQAALCTSGMDYRWWRADGERRHHLIDPRTGRPAASDLLTATVLAAGAGDAEAWATALLVAGVDEGLRLAEEHGLAAAFFLDEEAHVLSTAMSRALVA